MNPDQTAPGSILVWVHIVCNIGYLRAQTDERSEDKSRDWREKSQQYDLYTQGILGHLV